MANIGQPINDVLFLFSLIHFMGKSESGVVGTITIVFSMLLVSWLKYYLLLLVQITDYEIVTLITIIVIFMSMPVIVQR